MPRRAGDRSSEVGLYIRELRLSLRNNSGAFGYSVMITCTMAMLTSIAGSPRPAHIVLFVLAVVASFALIEVVATRAFTRSLEDEHTTVIALGSSLNLISIALAVGLAAGLAALLPTLLTWLIAPFSASTTYLLFTAVEMMAGADRTVQRLHHIPVVHRGGDDGSAPHRGEAPGRLTADARCDPERRPRRPRHDDQTGS